MPQDAARGGPELSEMSVPYTAQKALFLHASEALALKMRGSGERGLGVPPELRRRGQNEFALVSSTRNDHF